MRAMWPGRMYGIYDILKPSQYFFSNNELTDKGFCYCKENPHLPQNEDFSGFDVPHFEHIDVRLFPQLLQNFEFLGFCVPQLEHDIPAREDLDSNFFNGS